MAKEQTLCVIKPDALSSKSIGGILSLIEKTGFNILALKQLSLPFEEVKVFYAVHKEMSFYNSLVQFMSSGPIMAMVLEKDEAIADLRKLMGATDPKKAEPGSIRAVFGTDIERNAVHGSDSKASASVEIPFFFSMLELIK